MIPARKARKRKGPKLTKTPTTIPKLFKKTCPVCSTEFTGKSGHRYCSEPCREWGADMKMTAREEKKRGSPRMKDLAAIRTTAVATAVAQGVPREVAEARINEQMPRRKDFGQRRIMPDDITHEHQIKIVEAMESGLDEEQAVVEVMLRPAAAAIRALKESNPAFADALHGAASRHNSKVVNRFNDLVLNGTKKLVVSNGVVVGEDTVFDSRLVGMAARKADKALKEANTAAGGGGVSVVVNNGLQQAPDDSEPTLRLTISEIFGLSEADRNHIERIYRSVVERRAVLSGEKAPAQISFEPTREFIELQEARESMKTIDVDYTETEEGSFDEI